MKARLLTLVRDERVKFIVVGVVNTLVGYGLFAFIQFLVGRNISYLGSLLLAHLLASIVAFNLYRHFVFHVRGRVVRDFLRFQTVYLLPLTINLVVLPILVEVFHLNVYLAQAGVTIVSTTISYLGHKFFSFRRPPEELVGERAAIPSLSWRSVREGEPIVYALAGLLSSAVTFLVLELWKADWRVLFQYQADALGTASQIKGTLLNGWYEHEPLLNAPHGQNFHDFTTADHIGLLFAKLEQVFTSDYAIVMNSYYVLTYPLAALAAAWFFRRLGISKVFAIALSVLYAIAPYHFFRGEGHLWLSGYFCIPLAMGLVYSAVRRQPLWVAPSGARRGLRLLLPLGTVVIAAVVGTTSTYYGIFTIALLALAGGIGWIGSFDWKRLLGAAVAAATVAFFMLVNMLPDMLDAAARGSNTAALVRPPGGTEFYSLKFASLVLPVPGDRIGILADVRAYYDAVFPLAGESPSLGFIAALGFIGLFGFAIYRAVGRTRGGADEFRTFERIGALSALTVCAFLLSTVGGLASIFGLAITSLRGWNRMSIVIALFALAAVGIVLDALLRKLARRYRLRRVGRILTAGALAVLLLVVGYLDQVTPASTPDYATTQAENADDQALVNGITASAGANAMILQLPYREYPESASSTGIADTDQLKFFLHSDTLKWSSGGVKGRPETEWVKFIEQLPVEQMVSAAAAAGFSGILVDKLALVPAKDGTGDTARGFLGALASNLGPSLVSTPDKRYQYFSLAEASKANSATFTPSETEQIGTAAVSPVTATLQPDNLGGLSGLDLLKPFKPRLFLQSARDTDTRVDVVIKTDYSLGSATIRFTDDTGSTTDVHVASIGNEISLPLTVAPGRSYVDLSLVEGTAWPTRINAVFTNTVVTVHDLQLDKLLSKLIPTSTN